MESPRVNVASDRFELARHVRQARYFFRTQQAEMPGPTIETGVVYGGWEDCEPAYEVDRVSFPYPVIEMVVGGRGRVRLGDREHDLEPGFIFGYRPGVRLTIRGDPANPLQKYFVCLGRAEEARVFGEGGPLEHGGRLQGDVAGLRRTWDDLIEEGNRSGPETDVICAVLIDLLLLKMRVLREQGETPLRASRRRFAECRELIERRAAELSGLADIAHAAGLAPSELCRLFRRHGEGSPGRVLMRRKMMLAAGHLLARDCLVKEAGYRVGLRDPYHFSRVFKRHHGVSPAEFRRTLRRG